MSTQNATKINYLLQHWVKGMVMTNPWLKQLGINNALKHRYIKSKWLNSIGNGIVIRAGDEVSWLSGVLALQSQLKIPVHIAGKTALELMGFGHFIKFRATKAIIFTVSNITIPKWFLNHNWDAELCIIKSKFLPPDIGIEKKELKGLSINLSSPERAVFELLYLVPNKQSFEESYLIMENLVSLRPNILQQLLEQCKSVKVKRLFLFLAEKLKHQWFSKLDLKRINIGKGKRSIVKNGQLEHKYQITIPKGFASE